MTMAGNRDGLAMASERKPTASTDEAAVARDGVAPRPDRTHRTTFKHATLLYQDERNSAKTVRGIGFRGVCSCGEQSRVYASVRMAQAWGREHAPKAIAETGR